LFVILSTVLGILLMFVGFGIGMLLHFAFGIDDVSKSPAVLGGLTVGISAGIFSALILSVCFTIKVAPTEANRLAFLSRTAETLGKPNLAHELGYGEQDDDDDSEGDWWTRARDRGRGEDDYSVLG
jgi:hypothetical protein